MIAVTGGTGLLGGHLLSKLLIQGYSVKALKRSTSSTTLLRKILSYYSDTPDQYMENIEWHTGDITNIISLEDFLEEGDQVFHCAGYVSFERAKRNLIHLVNVEGTTNVVNAALMKNINKLVFSSSTAAIGRADKDGVIHENSQWKNSKSNSYYAVSKMLAEREVWRGQMEGLKTAIVNPGIILGAGPWDSGSSKLFSKVSEGLRYYTSGVNGYVDVRDVVDVMIQLMQSDIQRERFLLISENIDYKSLFSQIATHLNVDPPAIKANAFMAEVVWRLDAIKSFITGQSPVITKETARTALNQHFYSGKKITSYIDFRYRPIKQTIADTAHLFKQDNASLSSTDNPHNQTNQQ
ncbi:MAG: NAD-dependent epimerase/dehydratase family protein [Bacteroidales bacterium]